MSRLKELDYPCFDADQLSRKTMAQSGLAYNGIIETFGSSNILNEDKSIDRKKLAQLIFSKPILKKKLEDLTHPFIQQQLKIDVQKAFSNRLAGFWFYEAALIFETKQQDQFAHILHVYCSPKIQTQRLVIRGLDVKLINQIRSQQISVAQAKTIATKSINNDKSTKDLYDELDQFINQINKEL